MFEASKQFRRVNSHLHLPALRAAPERHVAQTSVGKLQHSRRQRSLTLTRSPPKFHGTRDTFDVFGGFFQSRLLHVLRAEPRDIALPELRFRLRGTSSVVEVDQVTEYDRPHDSIALSSARPLTMSASSSSISVMISRGGRCSTSSYSFSLYRLSERS